MYIYLCCIAEIAEAADKIWCELLTPDEGCQYDRLIEINLDLVTLYCLCIYMVKHYYSF